MKNINNTCWRWSNSVVFFSLILQKGWMSLIYKCIQNFITSCPSTLIKSNLKFALARIVWQTTRLYIFISCSLTANIIFCTFHAINYIKWSKYKLCSHVDYISRSLHFQGNMTITCVISQYEGILPKGPYLPCVSMAGTALLAGYHQIIQECIVCKFVAHLELLPIV